MAKRTARYRTKGFGYGIHKLFDTKRKIYIARGTESQMRSLYIKCNKNSRSGRKRFEGLRRKLRGKLY